VIKGLLAMLLLVSQPTPYSSRIKSHASSDPEWGNPSGRCEREDRHPGHRAELCKYPLCNMTIQKILRHSNVTTTGGRATSITASTKRRLRWDRSLQGSKRRVAERNPHDCKLRITKRKRST